jgi:hypothetical protein
MPISNRQQTWVQQKIGGFSAPEQREINDALDELELTPSPPSYHPPQGANTHGNPRRIIELGASGIRIDYKFDFTGLVTIIDVYRSPWHAIKVRITDFSS